MTLGVIIFVAAIGILSSILGIIQFFFPNIPLGKRIVIFIIALAVSIVCGVIVEKGMPESCKSALSNADSAADSDTSAETAPGAEIHYVKPRSEPFDPDKQYEAGDRFLFGSGTDDEPLEWRVLATENGKALVIAEEPEYCVFYDYTAGALIKGWKNSPVRKYLNEIYINACFSDGEIKRILRAEVVTQEHSGDGASDVQKTDDRIFCLSPDETEVYLGGSAAADKGIWLRLPGSGERNNTVSITIVSSTDIGKLKQLVISVRPVFWIDLAGGSGAQNDGLPQPDASSADLPYLSDLDSVSVGEHFLCGSYPQSGGDPQPVEWRVLDVRDGKALAVSEYLLDYTRYSDTDDIEWETCSLRQRLNGDFLSSAFTEDERKRLVLSGNDLVFCLSLSQRSEYFESGADCFAVPSKYALRMKAETEGQDNTDPGEKTDQWWCHIACIRSYMSSAGGKLYDVKICYGDSYSVCYGVRIENLYAFVRPAVYFSVPE